MAFLVIARDGDDEAALDRRMAVRSEHLARVALAAGEGMLLLGGALTDGAGRMTGSMMVLDLPDEAAVRQWMAQDPYTLGDVWRDVTVTPFRPAALPYRTLPQPPTSAG